MSIQSYYRWALLLPVVVPFLGMPLFLLGEAAGSIVIMLQYALMIGGIPYLLFAGAFVMWSRGRSDREVHVAILVSPLAYAVVVFVCGLVVAAVIDPLWMSVVWILALYAVVIGYGYVILAELGRVLLRPGPSAAQPAA